MKLNSSEFYTDANKPGFVLGKPLSNLNYINKLFYKLAFGEEPYQNFFSRISISFFVSCTECATPAEGPFLAVDYTRAQASVQQAPRPRHEPQVTAKLEVRSPKVRDLDSYLGCWLVSPS